MRLSPRTWALASVVLLLLAGVCWQLGERRRLGPRPPAPAEKTTNTTSPSTVGRTAPFQLLTPSAAKEAAAAREAAAAKEARRRYPNQLSNTRKSIGQLVRTDTAVMLQNALIDTAEGTRLPIPAELRSQGDPGAYIVQARGAIDAAFRRRLADVGASIVSYIPNNAYLVRMPAPGAALLNAAPQVQSVLPFEPYYKLDTNLLAHAVTREPLPEKQRLSVIGFPGEAGATRAALGTLGAKIISEEPTPFGQKFVVEPAEGSLTLLAQSTAIQQLEVWHGRVLLNDFARLRLKVATNSDAMTFNYVPLPNGTNLTGAGITVNINDTGVDATHPDLTGRVTADFAFTLVDFNGHGTHVGGTIMSSGANSPMNMVSTNGNSIPGSASNANFRGIAYGASLYALPIFSFFGSSPLDYYLQTNAANQNYGVLMRTNPMVSNNSWGEPLSPEYNSTAASFDAAVRDALPETPGNQPLIYVFAAGNSGFAADEDNGLGGFPDSVISPGTAKNVITVGAIENPRFITNTAVFSNTIGTNMTLTTNAVFYLGTDTSNQVASFSSRGNVGIGLEGAFGRFKPDVVAPGVFTISTRATNWNLANDVSPTNPLYAPLLALNSKLAPYYRYESGTSMAAPAISGMLALIQEYFETQLFQSYSPALMKALLINGSRSLSSFSQSYGYAVRDTINYQGWGLPNLSNSLPTNLLNAALSPMVLIDESLTNAVTTGQSVSYQLTMNSLSTTNPVQPGDFPLRITLVWTDPPGNPIAATKLVNDLDLIVSNANTGEVFYGNNFAPAGGFTDSVVGTNSPVLDQINNVENVFINGPLGTNYVITVRGTRVNVNALTAHTNGVAQDFALVISSDYSDPTGLGVQPFVLAPLPPPPPEFPPMKILTNGIGFFRERVGANSPLINSPIGSPEQWNFYVFTNLPSPNANQSLTNGTNVAFIIFFPPNISQSRHIPNGPFFPLLETVAPRNLTADVDLYVSTDPNLTNLLPAVLSSPTTLRSTNRGGNELVALTNANLGDVFYVGVKSEDQRGGEFSLIALSTDQPFGQRDTNGDLIIPALPAPMPIPDGLPELPSIAVMFGISLFPTDIVNRVVVSNTLTHDLYGDLFADVQHTDSSGVGRSAVLYNHNLFDLIQSGSTNFVFDDSGRGDIPGAIKTDGGPGTTLNNFIGEPAYGVWQFTVSDNALSHVGQVDQLVYRIQPRQTNDTNLVTTLCGGEGFLSSIDVPPTATNLTVTITIQVGTQLEMYIRRDDPTTPAAEVPTRTVYDKRAIINVPGGSLTLGLSDIPPLRAGRYYILVFNADPNPPCAQFTGPFYQIDLSLAPATSFNFGDTNVPSTALDDALMRQTNHVSFDDEIYSVEVGVRLDHPRVSDLALHLISPLGSRVLLFENRGGTSPDGLGGGYPVTNVFGASSSGGFLPDTNVIPTGVNAGTLVVDFDFFSIPDRMTVYYDGTNIFDTGYVNGAGQFNIDFGPGLSTNITIIINEGTNSNTGTFWQYTAKVITGISYLVFTEETNKTMTPIKFATPPFGPGSSASNSLASNVYVLPEESLNKFRGESTFGDWYLEIWDTRVGAAVTNGLIAWNVRFVRADLSAAAGLNAVGLTNCTPYAGIVSNSQIAYFFLDVYGNATMSDNTLSVITSGGSMRLSLNRGGLPIGASPPDDYPPLTVGPGPATGIRTITTASIPPLLPGQRYYLSVENTSANQTNAYTLTACNNGTPRPFVPSNLTPLASGVTRATNIAKGDSIDYYRFNVSSNSTFTLFEIIGLNGNADLVVNRDSNQEFPLPTRLRYNEISSTTGTNVEVIYTDRFTPQVALTPGLWYLGVYNRENRAVGYSVQATEYFVNTNSGVTLAKGVTNFFTVPGGTTTTNVYRVNLDSTNSSALFEMFNLSGDADLFLGRGGFPSASLTGISTRRGKSPEQVVVMADDWNPDLTGQYWLVVANHQTNPVSFALRAAANQPDGMLLSAQPLVANPVVVVAATSGQPIQWNGIVGQNYSIEVSSNLTAWTQYATTVATNAQMKFTDPSPIGPLQKRFYRVRQIPP